MIQGISGKSGAACKTCGESLTLCSGHFGYVRLALPVFHVGYLKFITTILQNICKVWSHIRESGYILTDCRIARECYSPKTNDDLF
jgi:DNA-directed RNA polymerase III subunit RPC1